jgi:hypothetical protein
LDARTLDIKTIFGQERRHVVPLFQRPYVWERESQLEPLWEDIRAVAERQLAGQPVRAHFLGAIVLDQVPKPTGQVEVRQVIDGQQRLTTVQLVFEAFADYCKEQGKDKHYAMLQKLVRNDNQFSTDPDEQFKVWPTTQDQDTFRKVMNCGSPGELRQAFGVKRDDGITEQPIADAYLYFSSAIADWVDASDGAGSADTRLDALFRILREYVRLVVIDLDPNDDAQVIFETLNARGTPLLPADLVKNLLFHRAQIAGAGIESLYQKHWKHFDEDGYWREKKGRGHARRARIDTFLQHYLTVKRRDEVPVGHLYVAFREHAAAAKASEVLADIRRYADTFRQFEAFEPGTREALFVSRLSEMDLTTAHPVLLELLATHSSDRAQLRGILIDIESFLVRRMVCQLNTRGYNRLFIELLKVLGEGGGVPRERVRSKLLSGKSDSDRWPEDEEVKQAWLNNPLYRGLVRKRTRMLLEALEHALRTGKTERLTIDEKLTVEHLMPQDWEKHWPLPEARNSDDDLQGARDCLIHTLGNLTLLTKKLNPSVSNGPWEKKRAQITKHSILRLNNVLVEQEEWNERLIRKRGESLLKLFKDVWPRPS